MAFILGSYFNFLVFIVVSIIETQCYNDNKKKKKSPTNPHISLATDKDWLGSQI